MKLKITFVCGRTLGHIFPALNIASRVINQAPKTEIQFIISKDQGFLDFLSDFDKQPISIKPLCFKKDIFLRIWLFLKSFFEAYAILNKFKPSLIVSFGSYVSFPVVILGKFLKIPIIIHEQNLVPGIANKVLFNLADYFAISFKDSNKFLPCSKKIFYSGILLRPGLKQYTKEAANSFFNLEPGVFTILIMGGSQGSHNINALFLESIKKFPNKSLQIIHLCGRGDYAWLSGQYKDLGFRIYLAEFLKDISFAYSVADLVIARAGAMTISEIVFFKKPSILIPYPWASAHQMENAKILANIDQRCIILEEKILDCIKLTDNIMRIRNSHLDKIYFSNELFDFNAGDNFMKKIYSLGRI